MKRWGATEEEWAQLKKLAKVDLLPVVSNPNIPPTTFTKIRSEKLGKIPSLIVDLPEGKRFKGFPEWTTVVANLINIDAWKKEPDHGVCVQTRRVRALDVDLSDVRMVARALAIFAKRLGVRVEDLPIRGRANSSRCLVAFVCKDESTGDRAVLKHGAFKAENGLVEFLGTGRQFVAAGMHTSGERYTWAGGLPASWPVFEWEDVKDAIWAIYDEIGIDGTWRGFGEKLNPGLYEGELDVDDPVAEHIVNSGWPAFYTEGNNFFIECPWKDGHSGESGETETAWLMAGTANYRNGHFKCLHASCSGRTDQEFFDAVGYRLVKPEEFEDLTKEVAALEAVTARVYQAPDQPLSTRVKEQGVARKRGDIFGLPSLQRHPTNGSILTNLENTRRMLKAPDIIGGTLGFDNFRAETMFAELPGEWRMLEDADCVQFRITMEDEGFRTAVTKEMMRDAIMLVRRDRQFDSAMEWGLKVVPKWDGVERIARFCPEYLKTKDTPYTRAVSRYMWTAQAGRLLSPGCQVDMVPVLVGAEGTRKTSAIKAISPSVEFFTELHFDMKDDDLARLMRGALVGELSELRGMSVKAGEAIKNWITRATEKWIPKYHESAITMFRRLVVYGTTNDPEFLNGNVGTRRWLPVEVLSIIDTDKIVRDRLQLWAEAMHVFQVDGILQADAERLAKAEHATFAPEDPLRDRIAAWLDQHMDPDGEGVTWRHSRRLRMADLMVDCLGVDLVKLTPAALDRDSKRYGAILTTLGMVKRVRRMNGKNTKVWINKGG